MRKAEFIGFAKLKGKDVIVFQQHGILKVTDGFHDRKLWDGEREKLRMNDANVRPDKLVKRLRGARPWHPVLREIENKPNWRLI